MKPGVRDVAFSGTLGVQQLVWVSVVNSTLKLLPAKVIHRLMYRYIFVYFHAVPFMLKKIFFLSWEKVSLKSQVIYALKFI